ncbi:MAG: flagellar protein [Gammaproteobacteria bacterium]|nr:flagellar protein [Gammaproteobacteria bacterium]
MAATDDSAEKSKSSSTLKIIIIVLASLLIIGGTVGGLYVGGILGGSADSEESDGDDDEEEPAGIAIYIPMNPAFVVNFAAGSKARFLQITLELMTRSVETEQSVAAHLPVIRNNLLLLFSSQTYESVSTQEGKEALREEALSSVQEILESETGDPGIEAIYFTSFVMQ